LYEAMANLTVTPPSPTKVYALRTNASVFGHNAPLQPPVLGPGGVVIKPATEWSLKNFSGFLKEGFEIKAEFSPRSEQTPIRSVDASSSSRTVTIKVTIDDIPPQSSAHEINKDGGQFSIRLNENETITVTISDVAEQGDVINGYSIKS